MWSEFGVDLNRYSCLQCLHCPCCPPTIVLCTWPLTKKLSKMIFDKFNVLVNVLYSGINAKFLNEVVHPLPPAFPLYVEGYLASLTCCAMMAGGLGGKMLGMPTWASSPKCAYTGSSRCWGPLHYVPAVQQVHLHP